MRSAIMLVGTAWALSAMAGWTSAESIPVPKCFVFLIEEALVPAQEAGVLKEIRVGEGDQVQKNDLLAQIDDKHAQVQLKVMHYKLVVATEQAENDARIRFAIASAKVARAEYLQAEEANRKVAGTVPQAEVRRLLLAHDRAIAQIEMDTMDQRIAAQEANVAQAEVEAAETNIERHQIRAPLDGAVVELKRHNGEWVKPGDAVLHVMRLDRLRIQGFLNVTDADPAEVNGRPVQAQVEITRNRKATIQGRITFVSPLVQAGGDYQIWAEVVNQQRDGQWVLRPGLRAEMTIQLK